MTRGSNTAGRIRRALRLLVPALLLLAGSLASYRDSFERYDRYVYDSLSSFHSRAGAEDIIIIAIDENSLATLGRWPWPRGIHAQLIDKLSLGGAKAIGFDILFTEPTMNDASEDSLLAEAMARSGKVIVPVISAFNTATDQLQLLRPIVSIEKAAGGLGHVDFGLDSDGILRRVFLKAGHENPVWSAMSLAMLELVGWAPEADLPGNRNNHLNSTKPGNWVRDYEVLIPFGGPPGHYRNISYADFIRDDFDPAVVEDKYVFVGITTIGLGDALPTPVSGEAVPMPGVEINANLLEALEKNLTLRPMTAAARTAVTFLLIILPLAAYPYLSQRKVQLTILATFFGTIALSAILLVQFRVWFPPVTPLVMISVSFLVWTSDRLEKLLRNLFWERERALVTLHSIGDGVITTDTGGWVEYLNPVAEKITGFPASLALGKHVRDILPIVDQHIGRDKTIVVEDCLRKDKIIHLDGETLLSDRDGKEHALLVSAGPLHDQSGVAIGVVLGISDVTEKRKALRELDYRATHDILTGLPNRSLLSDRLNRSINRARQTGKSVAVLFINLDNFKKANDQLGHEGGNRLLKYLAERLVKAGSEENTVSRVGGDEFAVMLEGVTDSSIITSVAANYITLLEKPFHVDGREIFITGCIGVSIFPKDGDTFEELIRHADLAMHEVKKRGTNSYLFYSSEMNVLLQKRLNLEARLRSALKNREFKLYYQPQIRAKDNRIIGVEALLRWLTEENEFISPGEFIPVAEESGLILPLSQWVLHTACRQARQWQDELQFRMTMSVNLSPQHFQEADLPDQLSRIVRDTGIDRTTLDLEITEGLIMQDVQRSAEVLREFKERGGSVSIDDFGTGYSSLAYLKHLPLDKLKIDKSFIHNIDSDERDRGISQTIITMGHSLGLSIVAEGVENQRHLDILRSQQCDIIQGYYYAKPLPAETLTAMLKKSRVFTI